MNPTIWLTKLLLSHLLTDFVLQPRSWVENRHQRGFRSPFLYLHSFITAVCAWIFMGWQYWPYAIVILVSHFLIDGWKSFMPNKIRYFIIDQALHVAVMVACWGHAFFDWAHVTQALRSIGENEKIWIVATAFVFLSFPSGILIGQFTRKWSDQLPNAEGLANAGKWIGIMERSIIFILLLQDQFGAIGLLITAKGLLRFSEKDKQEQKTEYVLIGTLISVSLSILTGIVTIYLI